MALERRLARDTGLQEQLIARYKQDHAEEVAQLARDREAFQRRIGLAEPQAPPPARRGPRLTRKTHPPVAPCLLARPRRLVPAAEPPPELGRPREEIVAMYQPAFGDPRWFAWQPAWFWMVMLAASSTPPSAAVTIALEDSLPRALNPLNVVHLIQAMGGAYFVLWGLLPAIAGSRQLALTLGASWPPRCASRWKWRWPPTWGWCSLPSWATRCISFTRSCIFDVQRPFSTSTAKPAAPKRSRRQVRPAPRRAMRARRVHLERKLQDPAASGKRPRRLPK